MQDLSFADSMDPERSMGSFSYIDVLDPPEGDRGAGWPRMLIENRAYATKVFRKLHMELATRQDGLQVRSVALCCLTFIAPGTPAQPMPQMCPFRTA